MDGDDRELEDRAVRAWRNNLDLAPAVFRVDG